MIWTEDGRRRRPRRLELTAAVALAGGSLIVCAVFASEFGAPEWVAGLLAGAAIALPIGTAWGLASTKHRWYRPVMALTEQLADRAKGTGEGRLLPPMTLGKGAHPALLALTRAIDASDATISRLRRREYAALTAPNREVMTRSALFDPRSGSDRLEGSSQFFETRDMVGRLDPDSLQWTEASPALQSFLGAGIDQLRKLSILELFHPDDRVPAARTLQEAAETGEVLGLIYRVSTLGGNRKAVELNVSTRYDADGSVVYLRCHVTDVTDRLRARREERKRTRELLRLNEELRATNRALAELKDRYSDLYQNAPAMYFSLDREGNILVCNDTLLRTLGYTRRSLIGQPYAELLPEALRPSFRSRFSEFLQEGRIEVESQWLTRDGRAIDVFVTAVAVRDVKGRLIHSRSVAQDITTRKLLEAELRQNNERLGRINDELSRKNTELDEFSYVISHDLQEPIRTLIAFSGFLKQDYADRLDDQAREFLDYLTEASSRMRALIQDLLELSRAGRAASDFRPVSLEETIATLRVDYSELIRSRAGEVEIVSPLPAIWGDPTRIGQLLGNLICNGLKYNESRPPRVEVGVSDAPGPNTQRRVTLMIRDNGIGIDPQFHETIFQMFRRLHPRGRYEGTGAGLAICQKIARAHGGRLWVESIPGAGSTFYVDLPLAPAGSHSALSIAEPRKPVETLSAPDEAIHVR